MTNNSQQSCDLASNLRAACEAFLREQSKRISPTPRAELGSYYRGYDNGMSDILYGLREVLARTPVETRAIRPSGFYRIERLVIDFDVSVAIEPGSDPADPKDWLVLRDKDPDGPICLTPEDAGRLRDWLNRALRAEKAKPSTENPYDLSVGRKGFKVGEPR